MKIIIEIEYFFVKKQLTYLPLVYAYLNQHFCVNHTNLKARVLLKVIKNLNTYMKIDQKAIFLRIF